MSSVLITNTTVQTTSGMHSMIHPLLIPPSERKGFPMNGARRRMRNHAPDILTPHNIATNMMLLAKRSCSDLVLGLGARDEAAVRPPTLSERASRNFFERSAG